MMFFVLALFFVLFLFHSLRIWREWNFLLKKNSSMWQIQVAMKRKKKENENEIKILRKWKVLSEISVVELASIRSAG